jgi:hypothetical protein
MLTLVPRAYGDVYAHANKAPGTSDDLSQFRYEREHYAPREGYAYPLPSVQCKLTSSAAFAYTVRSHALYLTPQSKRDTLSAVRTILCQDRRSYNKHLATLVTT